jgi:hypothetical protein
VSANAVATMTTVVAVTAAMTATTVMNVEIVEIEATDKIIVATMQSKILTNLGVAEDSVYSNLKKSSNEDNLCRVELPKT